MPQFGIDQEAAGTSVRELLAHYDQLVQQALSDAVDTTTGTRRVQSLYVLGRAISTHDSVVGSTLCPLLDDLPGGPEVAGRLRQGCEERDALLSRFQALTGGIEARNVYPVFGTEVENVLAELKRSFAKHVDDETTAVSEVLEAAAASVSPEVVAVRMAIEAGRAPSRAHRAVLRHPESRALRAFYRGVDRIQEWNDSHHGWPSRRKEAFLGPVRPPRRFTRRAPSIPDLLAGYDETVEAVIADLTDADRGPGRAAAAYRLGAAVAIHDSIVEGPLCRLLDAVPESRSAAATLHAGCEERSELLDEWNDLVKRTSPSDLFETHSVVADRIVDRLVASFEAHESRETEIVAAAVERLQERSWRSGGTGLISPYLLLEWPNPDPGVLAAHMALWAEKAPTRSHPLVRSHPTNRLLRNFFRRTDQFQDWRRYRHGWPSLR